MSQCPSEVSEYGTCCVFRYAICSREGRENIGAAVSMSFGPLVSRPLVDSLLTSDYGPRVGRE